MESTIQLLGAGAFGVIIGWYVYFINRYRKGDVTIGDLATVIGIIGGAAVTALFSPGGDMFGAYGIGLFIGFFAYFLMLSGMVSASSNFDKDWFLDGRRKRPVEPMYIPDDVRSTVAGMSGNESESSGFGQ
jgi:hypothetical protein